MPTVKESAVRAMASGSVERFTDPKVGLSLVLTSLEGVRYLYGGLFRYEGVASQVKTGDVIGYAARAIPPVVETVPLQLAAPPKVEVEPAPKVEPAHPKVEPKVEPAPPKVEKPVAAPVKALAVVPPAPEPSPLALVVTSLLFLGVAYLIFKPSPKPRKKSRKRRSRVRKTR